VNGRGTSMYVLLRHTREKFGSVSAMNDRRNELISRDAATSLSTGTWGNTGR
jgi:hypothetical protein